MEPVPMHGDLQIDQDLRFSEREWRVQRVGWLAMVIFIGAASAGLLGRGALSEVQQRTADGRLAVEHQRVGRHGAPDVLHVEVAPGAATDGMVRVWLDRGYIQERTIQSITPEPEKSSASGDRIIYDFRLDDLTRKATIAFRTQPDAMWRQRGAIGLVGGDSLRISQFVLP